MVALIDYSGIQTLPAFWAIVAQKFPQVSAIQDPHGKPALNWSYTELYENLQQFAAGLQQLGLAANDRIAIFADNSPRWLVADQGSLLAGAINVVRSSQAEREELRYILQDSGSTALIVEDAKTLAKLQLTSEQFPLKFVVLLSDEAPPTEGPFPLVNFQQVLEQGQGQTLLPSPQDENSLATLIYTSGTTGQPKGVMLSHGNLLHQVRELKAILQPQPGDRVLSILPSWHSYERSAEYFLLSQGCTQIYTSIRTFKNDLKKFKPQHMVGVPRLWESLYEGIQKQFREQSAQQQRVINFCFTLSKRYILARRISQNLSLGHLHPSGSEKVWAQLQTFLLAPLHGLADKIVYRKIRAATGGEVKTLISGGGSLARHLDDFYEIVGIPLLVGYGLTETSPVTNARTPQRNLRYSAGQPIPGTEIRIVDPETLQVLQPEQRGLVLIRGPQVMQGYYGKPEATAKAIDPEGWFDSGDLGWVTKQGDLVLTGRAKDTIVLSNGENIEPQPIEDACVRSAYIDQIMLVGQDQKFLGALIVPNLEALQQWARQSNLTLHLAAQEASPTDWESSDFYRPEVVNLFREELNREVKNRPGYRADDQIKAFRLVLEPFSMDNGMMTQTLKIKRPVVTERYRGMIERMFE
ncbi:long-chain fatty acid--CoA ligase [Synechocystis sp. LKSZ1]|uniref:AMP-dependent synthetase/ligase n=1 Tax=Synechocystis sp. LKSZ1 TaxID=3144951 RepID=UPI00336C2ED2